MIPAAVEKYIYYQEPGIVLLKGDCLEILPLLEPESVDLIFADPPFNVNKDYEDQRQNYYEWVEEWVNGCFDILKNTGSFYHMTISKHLENKFYFMGQRGVFIDQIIWEHQSSASYNKRFMKAYQPILLYGKTEDYYFDNRAEKLISGRERWGIYKTEAKGLLTDLWKDITFIFTGAICHKETIKKPGTNKKAHPCQSPIKLHARPINFSTRPGDTVLDPFLGSGTTAVAAKQLGRKCIGIEQEAEFLDLAIDRLQQGILL